MTESGPDRRAFLRLCGGLCIGAVAGDTTIAEAVGSSLSRAFASSRDSAPTSNEVARAFRSMGTLLEVRIQGMKVADAVQAIRLVRRRVAGLEAALTVFVEDAPLRSLGSAPEGRWVDAPRDLIDALALAGDAVRSTGGTFDPTVAPMMRAWGLYDSELRHPDRDRWRAWRERPGWDAIETDPPGSRMRRLDARVEIDLGGIGKGIAIGAAADVLRENGAESALVNFGGSLGAVGSPVERPEGWPVGIGHPRIPGAIWSHVSLRSGFLSTSADSERFHIGPDGTRCHHILDPHGGRSVPHVASVTLWSESGVGGDVESTAAFVNTGRAESEPHASGGPQAPNGAPTPPPGPRGLPQLTLLDEGAGVLRELTRGWSVTLG